MTYDLSNLLVIGTSSRALFKRRIRAARYSRLLLCYGACPKRGLDFGSWVRPLLTAPKSSRASKWIHETLSYAISAKKARRSNPSFILELCFGPPSSRFG
jgi:hypothetical protein